MRSKSYFLIQRSDVTVIVVRVRSLCCGTTTRCTCEVKWWRFIDSV